MNYKILIFLFGFLHAAKADIAIDKTFGNNGMVFVNCNLNSGTINEIVPSMHIKIQSDGKFIVIGDIYTSHINSAGIVDSKMILVLRFNPNGTLDNTFGIEGKVILKTAKYCCTGIDLDLQKDGKIIIAARSWDRPNHCDATLIRLHTNGELDFSFGKNGIIKDVQVSDNWSNLFRVKVLNNNKIVASGNQGKTIYYNNTPEFINCSFYTAQYQNDGSPDESFGQNGKVKTILMTRDGIEAADESFSLAVQNDSKLIIAGCFENAFSEGDSEKIKISSSKRAALIRYTHQGKLDKTFGVEKTGIIISSLAKQYSYSYFTDVMIQPDEKIIAIGTIHNSITSKDEFLIIRYTKDGLLDKSFGENNDGIVITSIGTDNANPKNIALDKDGKILVTGTASLNGSKKFTLVRYTIDGIIDKSFGLENDGIIMTSLRLNDDESFAVAIANDEKILVAGDSFNGKYFDLAIACYTFQKQ